MGNEKDRSGQCTASGISKADADRLRDFYIWVYGEGGVYRAEDIIGEIPPEWDAERVRAYVNAVTAKG